MPWWGWVLGVFGAYAVILAGLYVAGGDPIAPKKKRLRNSKPIVLLDEIVLQDKNDLPQADSN